jgi:hypothetical protein
MQRNCLTTDGPSVIFQVVLLATAVITTVIEVCNTLLGLYTSIDCILIKTIEFSFIIVVLDSALNDYRRHV